ncbi:YycH family regulatory protein [Bacillus infantis]|uniref:YycH family regulatory protein n=1 Tax=Bacillus infantis TaxID=324767 RepID=UPI0030194643
MTYEDIKSIILAVLVSGSILLTWSLWTYQPTSEQLGEENTVQEVELEAKKDVGDLIEPNMALFHYEDSQHLGTLSAEETEKLLTEIKKWNFDDFSDITDEVGNIDLFVQEAGHAEIIYPGITPMNLYKEILQIKDRRLENIYFNKMVIDMQTGQKSGIVYFVDTERGRVYKTGVGLSNIQNFNTRFYRLASASTNPAFARYAPFDTGKKLIFIPENKVEMPRYSFLSEEYESERFKEALFDDLDSVQKSYLGTGEEFTNESSLLRIDQNMVEFKNPTPEDNESLSPDNLLKKSINYVNAHGGWTDNYRYVRMDENKHQVFFRIYRNNYPVFSEDLNLSEIQLRWGGSEILAYFRNNFKLANLISSADVTLRSGPEILDYLQKKEDFEAGKLEDITLGYQLDKKSKTELIQLEPSWFYKYEGKWQQISTFEPGGNDYGLEQN